MTEFERKLPTEDAEIFGPFNMRHHQRYLDLLQFNGVRGPRASVWTDVGDTVVSTCWPR
jgi:hypothetical protein